MANLDGIQTHAGHTVMLKIGGQLVGRAQGCSARRNFGTRGVYEIGTPMPIEHIPLMYSGEVTMTKFFIRKANDGGATSLRTLLKIISQSYGWGLQPGSPATDEDIILRTGLLNITVHSLSVKESNLPVEGDVLAAGIPTNFESSILSTIARSARPGQIIRAYIGCTLSTYSENFRANDIAGEDASFMFLDCLDAADQIQDTISLSGLRTADI